jgi:hypothetical protein
VQVPILADPAQTLARMREDLRGWDTYWARKQEESERGDGAEAPAAQEALQLRRMLRGFLAPRLDELEASPIAHRGLLLNLMVPFDTRGGLRDFILHFFQIGEGADDNLAYEERDPFERDVYVLYDLYRVKKTLEVAATLQAARQSEERRFPSIFSEAQIAEILTAMPPVLELMFAQCLPEKHRREILPKLSPAFLKSHSLLERRETELLYTYPHVLRKYDYRRFFFLIYFKNGLKARLGSEEKEFRYNFLHFQVLKHEFLVHWLTGPLRNDPRKYEVYSKYMVQGKSLLTWISEDEERELPLLNAMASHTLNDMASQVNEVVPEELKVGVVPESRDFGFYHQLKQNLVDAVEMVRTPIENLRRIVEKEGPPQQEPEPEPPPPADVPAEPRWEVTLLKKNQVLRPFFMETMAGFNTQLGAVRARLGADWPDFAKYVSTLLQNTPEMATIRRRTPKHEWSMPYRIRRVSPGEKREYLLVLGAEVKARQRGMGYQTEEAYNFTPYFVFAADVADEDFGGSTGERVASGRTLQEYPPTSPAVVAKVLELLEIVKGGGG